MGADESKLEEPVTEHDGQNRIGDITKQEFADSLRSLYAQRYFTSQKQLVARDAENGMKIEPVRKQVTNGQGEACFDTDLHVMLIVYDEKQARFLFPQDREGKEAIIPMSRVKKNESLDSAVERLKEEIFIGHTIEVKGVCRFEFTPRPNKVSSLVIYRGVQVGEDPGRVETGESFDIDWFNRRGVARSMRKRSSIMRRTPSLSKSQTGLRGKVNDVTLAKKVALPVILKWIEAGTFSFSGLLQETGTINEPSPQRKAERLEAMSDNDNDSHDGFESVEVDENGQEKKKARRARPSTIIDVTKGNRYAYRVVLCCKSGDGDKARVLFDKQYGLPKKSMTICTSFEDIANDLLIDVCAKFRTEAKLDGIIQIDMDHSNDPIKNDHGCMSVYYLCRFSEDVLEMQAPKPYKWISLRQARKANPPELPIIESTVKAKFVSPIQVLANERSTYIKLSELNVREI